jgi:energy-coupling factor transport system ATP-binding protein
VLDLLSLNALRDRRLETLSGGERQRVAMATALVLRPEVLVLDEPTSQLDPKSAYDVLETLVKLNRTLDLTVLLAEHRIERVLPFADQLIALNVKGRGGISGPPRQVFTQTDITPPVVTLGKELGWQPLPLTVEEGRKFIPHIESRTPKSKTKPTPVSHKGEPHLQIHDLEVRYGNQIILDGVNLDLQQGEILVLMGPNGAGKTTLLRTIVGLLQPDKGKVIVGGVDISNKRMDEICRVVGYLPQDPNALLFADSALEELMITLRNHAGKMDEAGEQEANRTARALLERLGLINQADDYPRDLSVGQRQRVALGTITVTKPTTLLLDEPTRGLDYGAKQSLAQLLRSWRDEGMAILLVTHDVELAAKVADRAAILKQGKISSCGDPSRVMRSTARFTPQIARLFPDTDWLTVQDAFIGIRQMFL